MQFFMALLCGSTKNIEYNIIWDILLNQIVEFQLNLTAGIFDIVVDENVKRYFN
jgi:hypothetical protein